jgi:hypothetical protein
MQPPNEENSVKKLRCIQRSVDRHWVLDLGLRFFDGGGVEAGIEHVVDNRSSSGNGSLPACGALHPGYPVSWPPCFADKEASNFMRAAGSTGLTTC